MTWLKRRKKETSAVDALVKDVVKDANKNDAASSGPRFWIDHGLENGDRVECAVCGESLVVRLVKNTKIVVATVEAQAGSPLICGDCGRLFCVECSIRQHPNRPTCDRCQRVGGVTGLMK